MKRRLVSSGLLLLLIPFLLSSCFTRDMEEPENYGLWQEFNFREENLGKIGKPALFQLRRLKKKGKRYPSLVQKGAGSMSFYVRIPESAVLVCSVQSLRRKKVPFQASVIVESDYPDSIKREYRIKAGNTHRIELQEFEDRVARITLKSGNKDRTIWTNPVMEHIGNPGFSAPLDLDAFRERHADENVLLIVLDAASPFHFGSYGYLHPTTPALDRLAKEGVTFENAISQAVYTPGSTATLFTGLYPDIHGVGKMEQILSHRWKTLAEAFREGGYETGFFTGTPVISPLFGYHQGFEHIVDVTHGGPSTLESKPTYAIQLVPEVNSWLERVQKQRFFAYVHFREPHLPYRPADSVLANFRNHPDFQLPIFKPWFFPPADQKERLVQCYDANLAFVDRQVGKIVERVRALNLKDNTIIVVVSDHGEAFGEHAHWGHMSQLYNEVIRIPMILRLPGEPQLEGRRITDLVGTIDLMPSFLDLLNFSTKGIFLNGRSLLPILAGERQDEDRPLLSQAYEQRAFSLLLGNFKYIDHRHKERDQDEFYSLVEDPQEKANLMEKYPILSSWYRIELGKIRRELNQFARHLDVDQETAMIDKEMEEKLKALGYLQQ